MQSVLFDLDGTLVDSEPGIRHAVQAALADVGLETEVADLRRRIGPPVRDMLAELVHGVDTPTLDRLVVRFRHHYDGGMWRDTVLFPGVVDALLALQEAGCRLYVVTNKPSDATRRILAHLQIESSFEAVVSKDSVAPPFADKAAMIAYLVHEHGVDPSRCVFVGDGLEDAQAAETTGMAFVAVSYGYGDACTRARETGALQIDHIGQMMVLLGNGTDRANGRDAER